MTSVAMGCLPYVAAAHPPLELGLEVREHARNQPVHSRGNDQRFHRSKILLTNLGGSKEQFSNTDEADQGGVLEHGDELVSRGWDHEAQGLGKDDAARRLGGAHRKRVRGLDLAVANRLNAGPKDLGHVSPVVHAECQNSGGYRRNQERTLKVGRREASELREGQVDEEDLQDQWSSSNQRHVQRRDAVK